jgi:hypothetical protein
VASSGALDASKVQEAQSWVDDFSKELDKSKPKDLRKKIGEFDERLTEYVDKQELDSSGYDLLTARLRDLRSTL